MSDILPGTLLRVCLRCVLGFCWSTRGFVGLVLVVTGVAVFCPPSVALTSPSEVGTVPPIYYYVDCFFQFFYRRPFWSVLQMLDAFDPFFRYYLVVLLIGQCGQLAMLRKQIVRR